MTDRDDFAESISKLKTLGPSALDAEVLNLAPEGGGSLEVLHKFLGLLHTMLAQRRDFELGQTYLALFLKHHGDATIAEPLLARGLKELQQCQKETWSSVEEQMLYCMSVVQAFKRL